MLLGGERQSQQLWPRRGSAVRIVAVRQVHDTGSHSGVFQAVRQLLRGLLARLVFILIQDDVDRGAGRMGKLVELAAGWQPASLR